MTTQFQKGLNAEKQAAAYLLSQGMALLATRFKCPYGEIDLIMQDTEFIVAVEVKFRKNNVDSHYAISVRQKKRIEESLLYYLQAVGQNSAFLRIDVVLLSAHNEIIHYKNAW